MTAVDFDFEPYEGSEIIRSVKPRYSRKPASLFVDEPATLSRRQSAFYINLIRMACSLKSPRIPVDFHTADGQHFYLDRGCIKIAEHAGFIRPLADNEAGVVEHIELNWW